MAKKAAWQVKERFRLAIANGREMQDFLSKPVLYSVPGMDDVALHPDLHYLQMGDADLLMDIYVPGSRSGNTPIPVVLFVHGGPVAPDLRPRPKDWGQYRSYGRLLAASGLAAVTFNHRFWSRADLDTPARDVTAAIAYVREHAASFGIDGDRLCIWGISGGGPLISFVPRERPAFVRCLVTYYAVLDLRHVEDQSGYRRESIETYSAAAHLGADRPTDLPIFVARAGLDNQTINQSIDRFIRQAIEANACLDVANHPRGRHAFDILDDDARTREIIARTIAFVSHHI